MNMFAYILFLFTLLLFQRFKLLLSPRVSAPQEEAKYQ